MSQRIRIEAELVEQLTGLPLMQQPSRRQQLVQELRRRLDHRVALHNVEEPRRQSQEVVTACAPVPGALAVVVDVVELLVPAARQVQHLRRLQHEWEVAETLLDEDWSQLRQALVGVRPANPGRLYQLATGHQQSAPGEWCEHAWDMFVELSGQNAPASGLPPGMLFLLLLEQEVATSVATLIRHRNQRQAATQLGLTEQLDRRRASMNVGGIAALEPDAWQAAEVDLDRAIQLLEPTTASLQQIYDQRSLRPERARPARVDEPALTVGTTRLGEDRGGDDDPIGIVFVHGFGSSPGVWDQFGRLIRADRELAGFSCHTFG